MDLILIYCVLHALPLIIKSIFPFILVFNILELSAVKGYRELPRFLYETFALLSLGAGRIKLASDRTAALIRERTRAARREIHKFNPWQWASGCCHHRFLLCGYSNSHIKLLHGYCFRYIFSKKTTKKLLTPLVNSFRSQN